MTEIQLPYMLFARAQKLEEWKYRAFLCFVFGVMSNKMSPGDLKVMGRHLEQLEEEYKQEATLEDIVQEKRHGE